MSFAEGYKIEQLQKENDRQCKTIEDYQARIKELEASLSDQKLTREESARVFANTFKALEVDETMVKVFQSIREERKHQEDKWGDQKDKLNSIWHLILSEEVGEVAQSLLDCGLYGWPAGECKECTTNAKQVLEKELIQVAAVAVAWLEALACE